MQKLSNRSTVFGSVSISVSEACRLHDAVAKLIINLTLYHYSTFFYIFALQPDEDTGSAEEQPASNKAAPELETEV